MEVTNVDGEIETEDNVERKDELAVKRENKRTSAFLYFAATIASLNNITTGVTIIWISPVSSKLLSFNPEDNPLGQPVTTLELSLIGSLSQTGMLFGPVLLEKLFDKFGPKKVLNLVSIFVIISYIILAFAKNIYLYYAMILLIGILLGGNMVGLSMYISEITEDHNRGKLSCYGQLFVPVGNLYGFILGSFLSVKLFTLLCALPSLIMVIISTVLLPESPHYFIINNNRDQAVEAIKKLLGPDDGRSEEVADNIQYTISKTNKANISTLKALFTTKSCRNALIASSVLFMLVACTGLPSIMSYLEPVFQIAGTDISPSICAIVVGVVQILCYFAASILVEKLGRRPLLLFSSIGSVIPLALEGFYFYLLSINSPLIEHLRWLPVFGIMLLVVTGIIGIASVSAAYINEVFTSNVKSTAMSFVYSLSGILVAVSIFMFPIMMDTIGLAWSFWIFAIACVFGFIFIYLRVPETKGKNILEIQEFFSK